MIEAGSVPVAEGEDWNISSTVDPSLIYTVSKVNSKLHL